MRNRFAWEFWEHRCVIFDRTLPHKLRIVARCGSADIAQLIVDALNANVRARA